MIERIWAWLIASSSWVGPDGIGARLGEHVLFSVVVVAAAIVVGVPLGLWIGHLGRGRWLIAAANAARAVPTLGLLFALALWVGPHIPGRWAFVVPSLVALLLLAIPPVFAGTYAGVEAIDPAVRDAARAMGMSPLRVIRQVELPNAMPLVLSGVRSAMLQVVATATIAAYVGLGGLGRFLVDGLASGNYPMTAGGAILVAALALVIDAVLALAQRLLVPAGLRVRGAYGGRESEASGRHTGNPATAGDPTVSPAR